MGLLSKAAVKTADPGTAMEEIRQRLEKHFSSNTSLQGIVFEIPPDREAEDFTGMVNRVIALLGSALPLPSGRVLAIFPDTADRELIARQLEKSIKTKALVVFTAEEASKALEYIGPYL